LLFFRAKYFEKFEIFGYVANSNIFTQIFRHSAVRLDLKDLLELGKFRDLELRKLLNLTFFEHPKKIPRKYKMMYNYCFFVSNISRKSNFLEIL
jgi:hypothetical protein